jgi:hypothetical protein
MPAARSPIEMVKGVPAVVAPGETDASDPGWLLALLRNVDGWNTPRGDFSPLPGIGCLPAQVRLR